MSTSGSLLPTVTQEDPGESPIQDFLTGGGGSATLSPSDTLQDPPSERDEKEIPQTPATSPLSPQRIPLVREQAEGDGTERNANEAPSQGQTFGSPRLASFVGKEKAVVPSREYSIAYSEMFQDEGGGDGLACVESDDDGAAVTLRAVRWSESLQTLLSDGNGVDAFRNFVESETGSTKELDFWFACKGLAHQFDTSVTTANELVLLLWRSFIRSRKIGCVRLSDATYAAIQQRIDNKLFDAHIFDQAQAEVERVMSETVYRAFLKSEYYLSHLSQGRREPHSPQSPLPQQEGSYYPAYLQTLHEDSELDTRTKQHLASARLTSSNLLASANFRANLERKLGSTDGFYLQGSSSINQSPYHALYVCGHTVSLQDSELQSLSSGAYTDDTKSYTDSSVDGGSISLCQPLTRKQFKRHNQRIRENAMQNKDTPLMASLAGVHVVPRTMLNLQSSYPRADTNPKEFADFLFKKLEKCVENQENKERLMHSMCKITHSEDAPEEARREHAVNALPPNVLLNKLNEKVHLDDQDRSQSILDEHVARVWDSPIYSPGLPKQTGEGSPPHKAAKAPAMRQLPHLSYPQPVSASALSAHMSKVSLKPGRHHPAYAPSVPSGGVLYPSVSQSGPGTRVRYPNNQSVGGFVGHAPHNHLPKTGHHGRRRERGPDVYSTFSSDSGNVADYHDSSEHGPPPSHLPKSKSMPEYIENQAVGATSDGASSGGRGHPGSGTRRATRRPPADFTDSGVSVVSDSGKSGAPSTSSDRVESWLFQNRPYTCGGNTSHSVCPGGDRETSKAFQKVRGYRSTHTVAGSTSPGTQRRGGGSNGRKSQCSSSTSGNTCIVNPRAESLSGQPPRLQELSRDSPLGQAQSHVNAEKKKIKGGSSSSKSTGQSSSVGDGSGSNGSTLKKIQQPKSPKNSDAPPPSASGTQSGSTQHPSGALADVTTIVYSFQDDHVPFIIKVCSRPITLKKFKQHLHKKGAYRYFFKKFREDMGMVYEEITDDSEILPLFEGKVFVQIHKDENEGRHC